MKLVWILLVVLISFMSISSVSAEVHSGDVSMFISLDAPDVTYAIGGNTYTLAPDTTIYLKYKGLGSAGYPQFLRYYDSPIDKQGAYNWEDIPQNVGGSFSLYNGAEYAGGGSITVYRYDTSKTDIIIFFGSDFVPTVGETTYTMGVGGSALVEYYDTFHYNSFQSLGALGVYTIQNIAIVNNDVNQATLSSSEPLITYDYDGLFVNEYDINMSGYSVVTDITRQDVGGSLSSSKFTLRNSTGDLVYKQGTYQTANTSTEHDNGSYNYYLDVQNYGEVLFFSSIPTFITSVGTIELNQSSYTDPELIQIDAELTTYDFDNHIYRILMYYSDDGGTTWSRLTTSLNATSIISSTSESRTSDISSGFYNLPIKIKAVLEDYDKTTTISSVVATSSEVYYNPTAAYDYTFSGTVFDAGTGSPIEGATIAATGATTTSDTSTVTGRFKLYLVDGTYTINCSKSGYVSNVNEDIVVWTNISLYNIYLTQTSYTNGTINGIIKDVDTDESLQDVHLIFTNATDRIDAYTSTGGYYTSSGFAQSETYTIRAIKSGYYSYNGSVTIAASGGTHKSFDMVQINYSVTPTATVLDTYPDGEGHAWTNDEIVTMLRIVVPGVFMMMFIFLLLAVLMGVSGNNGGNGGQGMGMKELWQR